MSRKKKEKKIKETETSNPDSNQKTSRMLARCQACLNDYVPRTRGGNKISLLKLYYLPNDNLAADKKGLVCPMHKDNALPAGLILSEDCLSNQYGSAMGMMAFTFSEEEINVALKNQIWPKLKAKIELDVNMLSSLSDEQLLNVIKQIKKEAISATEIKEVEG